MPSYYGFSVQREAVDGKEDTARTRHEGRIRHPSGKGNKGRSIQKQQIRDPAAPCICRRGLVTGLVKGVAVLGR